MRLTAVTFGGYRSGEIEFGPLFDRSGEEQKQQLLSMIELIAAGIIEPDTAVLTSVTIVGHADRQDRDDMWPEEQRASEAKAAQDRATSAWEWLKARVTERLSQSQLTAGEWWETANTMHWALVYAGAGMLLHNPPTEAQRPLNRRVVFLISMFNR